MNGLLETLRWAALTAALASCVAWLADSPVTSVVFAGFGVGLLALRLWLHATHVVNQARDEAGEVGGRHRAEKAGQL